MRSIIVILSLVIHTLYCESHVGVVEKWHDVFIGTNKYASIGPQVRPLFQKGIFGWRGSNIVEEKGLYVFQYSANVSGNNINIIKKNLGNDILRKNTSAIVDIPSISDADVSDSNRLWVSKKGIKPMLVLPIDRYTKVNNWAETTFSEEYKDLIINSFRNELKGLGLLPNEKMTELTIVMVLKSKQNEYLFHAMIPENAITDYQEVISDKLHMWFFLQNKSVKAIGTQLDMLSIGDFDNDGKDEALFRFFGYNRDGYILFFNGFKNSIQSIWAYH